MSAVKRFSMSDVEEDNKEGNYVEYSSYMSLLREYAEFKQEVMNERKKN